eukprot:707046_1
MLHILLSLLFIYKTSCEPVENATTTATPDTPSTTEMYTTAMTATLADVTVEDDPTSEDEDCTFELMITLPSSEDIIITLCGFVENEQNYIGITVQIPQDKWVGFGFILPDNFNATFPMQNAYAFIIPQYKRKIMEVKFSNQEEISKGNGGKSLLDTMSIFEDIYKDGDRIVKIKRKLNILPTDLGSAEAATASDYFDFETIATTCKKEFNIIWAHGSTAGQQFKLNGDSFAKLSHHGYSGRGFKTGVKWNMIKGSSCGEQGDNANSINIIINIIVATIIGYYVYA